MRSVLPPRPATTVSASPPAPLTALARPWLSAALRLTGLGASASPEPRETHTKDVCQVRIKIIRVIKFIFNRSLLSVRTGECQHDFDCPLDKECVEFNCRNPCSVPGGACQAANAECRASDHRAVCMCPVGWAGHPHKECYQRKTLKKAKSFQFCLNNLYFFLPRRVHP